MSYRYSNASCEWGELFGLNPNDLEDWQLEKISIKKLTEIAVNDSRAEKILGDKLIKCELDELSALDRLEKTDIKKLDYLRNKYNECIKLREKEIDKASVKNYYRCMRSNYIFWNFLNDSNRAKELFRWTNSDKSIVNSNEIDFDWLYKKYSYLGDLAVKKMLKDNKHSRRPGSSVVTMIKNLPKELLEKHVELLFNCDKALYAHALSNVNMPREYIIKALRGISGKKRLPAINVTLTKSILEDLPTIMRLGVLESLMLHSRSNITFEDIETSEDLETLLFGSTIRHNERVSRVLKTFKFRYEKNRSTT